VRVGSCLALTVQSSKKQANHCNGCATVNIIITIVKKQTTDRKTWMIKPMRTRLCGTSRKTSCEETADVADDDPRCRSFVWLRITASLNYSIDVIMTRSLCRLRQNSALQYHLHQLPKRTSLIIHNEVT